MVVYALTDDYQEAEETFTVLLSVPVNVVTDDPDLPGEQDPTVTLSVSPSLSSRLLNRPSAGYSWPASARPGGQPSLSDCDAGDRGLGPAAVLSETGPDLDLPRALGENEIGTSLSPDQRLSCP